MGHKDSFGGEKAVVVTGTAIRENGGSAYALRVHLDAVNPLVRHVERDEH